MFHRGGVQFQRAQEVPDDVVVTRTVAEIPGLQPEDLGVLVYLRLVKPGSGTPGESCAAGMRALGWEMSDARLEEIASRLALTGLLGRFGGQR